MSRYIYSMQIQCRQFIQVKRGVCHGPGGGVASMRWRTGLTGSGGCPVAWLAAALLCLAGMMPVFALESSEEAVRAYWKEHEVDFTYKGFTTDYSCDGIRYKLRQLLAVMGAREDMKIRTGACFSATRLADVQPFVRVRLKFSALTVSADDAEPQPVPASWSEEHVRFNKPRFLEPGDCELVEHFRDYVLPSFEYRIVQDQPSCVPGMLQAGVPNLRVLILKDAASQPQPVSAAAPDEASS